MASHRRSAPTVAILDQVTNAYGILDTPNQDDGEAYVQVYGHCHLETREEITKIQRRLNTLENASIVVPALSPKGSLDTESHSSTIEDIHHELREMDERLKDFEEVATRRLTDVEDLVNEVKDGVQDQFDRLSNDVDEAETRVTERVDDLEKHMDESFVEVGKRFNTFEERLNSFEERMVTAFNAKILYLQDSWESQRKNEQAFRENFIADRLFEPAKLLGVKYTDSEGVVFYKFPLSGRVKTIGYYWKMHQPRNHYKLRALHEFYEIPFTDWARSEHPYDSDSEGDESLEPPNAPTTLSEAIAKYPDRAVRVLFMRLGLLYSKFEKQAEKLDAMEQESGKGAEKRAAASKAEPSVSQAERSVSQAPKTKIRRRNPSWGTTTESLPRSSTQSHE